MISIVVPVLNERDQIGPLFEHFDTLRGDREVIVADGGSHDDTQDIVKRYENATLVNCGKGRAVQMNAGARLASGDTVMFVHADSRLPANSLDLVATMMADKSNVAGSFYLAFDHNHVLLRLYSLLSRINQSICTYGDQCIFVRKRVFDSIGGFRNIPLMEDLEIQQRLRKAGRFVKIQRPVVTSSRRFIATGPLRQQVVNALLVSMYYAGCSPSFLTRFYPDSLSSAARQQLR